MAPQPAPAAAGVRTPVKAFVADVLSRVGGVACRSVLREVESQREEIQDLRMLVGELQARHVRSLPPRTPIPEHLSDIELRVSSQWGEDGIIEYLVRWVPIENETFVEFGVGDYGEANTRFLLEHRNWRGLVVERDGDAIDRLRARRRLSWRHDLRAVRATVTAENINEILRLHDVAGDIGLLGIDLDGVDYWVWRAIDAVSPRIVVCEYNSRFGDTYAVTVPYDPDFDRTRAHHSNLYFGASLRALCDLADEKGYVFVGCNRAGNDAFFVRRDCAMNVQAVDPADGYVRSRARESRDENGRLTFLSDEEVADLLGDCVVHDLRADRLVKLRDLAAAPRRIARMS